MQARLQVLSEEEKHQVHEQSLRLLTQTGVRIDTALGRRILGGAGAHVDPHSHIVRFPRELIEASLREAPKQFTLGARRPGWDLPMNAGQCTMLIDGEAMFVLDRTTGERRPGLIKDWLAATRLIDAMDEIGVYWTMVEASDRGDTLADYVQHACDVFANFSKHVQNGSSTPEESEWLLEVLQTIFGDREAIRRTHPLSFLLCPQSPLVIEGPHTDAYLALRGWDVPAAVMPMPLMGGTAPGTLISTLVLGNSEVLAMLCLVQAAAPCTPFIYAPALAVMDPRSGRYGGGPVEHGVLGAAAAEMARYYGLPVEGTGFSTDHHVPGIQAGYERAMNALMAVLTWPDILVGPGLLSGSLILSFEQLIIDAEIFRRCRRARQGIDTRPQKWLSDVLCAVGPGGSFIAERSTVEAVRSDEWYIGRLGVHVPFEEWDSAGRPALLTEARAEVDRMLAGHEPLPLDEDVEKELAHIVQRARVSSEP